MYIDDKNNKVRRTNNSTVGQHQQVPAKSEPNKVPLFNNLSVDVHSEVQIPSDINEKSSIMIPYDEKLLERMVKKSEVNQPVSTRVEKPKYFNFSFSPKSNVATKLFEGSVEDLNKCLENTKLKGQGQAFLDAQNKYGINALFLMSIAKVESGYGAKPKTYCKYNVVGMVGQKPKSYAECIDSLGRNLNKNYISKGHTTIEKIRDKYCNANNVWPKEIAKEMNNLTRQINSNLTL